MGLVLFGLEWLLKIQWEILSASWRVLYLSGLIGAGVSVYFGLLFALGLRLRDFKRIELN
jgi:peptidoglycan biosynthesis protein MviN/MurJ (putative lipid II flippase)